MTQIAATAIDTDVFSLLYLRDGANDPRIPGWREYLRGRRTVISFQTRAEVLAGTRIAQWGERRMAGATRHAE